jgi:SAM-dependent methyltransferase
MEIGEELWEGFWHDDVSVEQEVAWRVHETDVMPVIERHMPRQGELLDAGCGRGGMLIYLFRRGYPMRGCDLSQRNLDLIKAYEPDVPLDREDILDFSYADARFDAMFSYGVMEHFEDGPARALAEAHRILKPGGLIFVSVPYTAWLREIVASGRDSPRARRIFGKPPRPPAGAPAIPELAFRRADFASEVIGAGFHIVEAVPIFGRHHAAHMLPAFRSRAYPDEIDYGTILSPPLSRLGQAVYRVAHRLAPWSMAHFQFVVARRL